jgi:hypothetical protein
LAIFRVEVILFVGVDGFGGGGGGLTGFCDSQVVGE